MISLDDVAKLLLGDAQSASAMRSNTFILALFAIGHISHKMEMKLMTNNFCST